MASIMPAVPSGPGSSKAPNSFWAPWPANKAADNAAQDEVSCVYHREHLLLCFRDPSQEVFPRPLHTRSRRLVMPVAARAVLAAQARQHLGPVGLDEPHLVVARAVEHQVGEP